MSMDLQRFHATYFEESREGLDAMESGLLALEGGQGPAGVAVADGGEEGDRFGGDGCGKVAEASRRVGQGSLHEARDGGLAEGAQLEDQ